MAIYFKQSHFFVVWNRTPFRSQQRKSIQTRKRNLVDWGTEI